MTSHQLITSAIDSISEAISTGVRTFLWILGTLSMPSVSLHSMSAPPFQLCGPKQIILSLLLSLSRYCYFAFQVNFPTISHQPTAVSGLGSFLLCLVAASPISFSGFPCHHSLESNSHWNSGKNDSHVAGARLCHHFAPNTPNGVAFT